MIEELRKNIGNYREACKIVGITENTHYDWIIHCKEYDKEVEKIELELAKLQKKVMEGDSDAMILLLSTHAKDRGYSLEE